MPTIKNGKITDGVYSMKLDDFKRITSMSYREKHDRKLMVLAMEYIARHINDENIFWDIWATEGVADSDIPYGSFDTDNVDEYYIEDEPYKELINTFIYCMTLAKKDGFTTYDY